MGRVSSKYCVDCGSRLVFYPRLSNQKAPNEYRVMVYGCESCSSNAEKPKLLSLKRNQVDDPLETVEIEVTEYKQKGI